MNVSKLTQFKENSCSLNSYIHFLIKLKLLKTQLNCDAWAIVRDLIDCCFSLQESGRPTRCTAQGIQTVTKKSMNTFNIPSMVVFYLLFFFRATFINNGKTKTTNVNGFENSVLNQTCWKHWYVRTLTN